MTKSSKTPPYPCFFTEAERDTYLGVCVARGYPVERVTYLGNIYRCCIAGESPDNSREVYRGKVYSVKNVDRRKG